ncbi:MAG: choloylglycine hydrolase family protein [Candidatus Binatus sp.]|jgi:choloylglycine hydrolase|uniref:linear amide C-N hydrolase n=1 Tax=Candidatus Binatus sp. TaxID=2811406 RepID=UPI003D0F980F
MKITGIGVKEPAPREFPCASRVIYLAILACSLFFAKVAPACTGIRLRAEDGTVVYARTLEFNVDPDSDVIMVPRGYARTGTTPDGENGLKWTSKYASLGANSLGLPLLVDGVNEKGLAAGLFYFPTTAGYMKYNAAEASRTIAPWELASWILENFATVEEVKQNIGRIAVAEVVFKKWGMVIPVHFVVHDASGKSIVIEYIEGKLHVYDDVLGVLTNSPSFDWHMTNLRNYVNFSVVNVPPVKVDGITLTGLGQGTGMLGMPGDFTPPSRFVRAVAYNTSILPSKTGEEAVLQAFHILNNFDIPEGVAREEQKDAHGNVIADRTMWTSASDLKARRYYFRTHENSQIRSVDLMKMPLDANSITTFSMKGPEVIKSLNP